MGIFSKLLPVRQKVRAASVRTDVVADLDAILSEPVSFVLHGKEHIILPLNVEQFMITTSGLVDIYDLQKRTGVTADELIDKYYSLASSVCKTITRKDIEEMTQQQVGALFELITQTITGKIFAEKKTLKTTSSLPI